MVITSGFAVMLGCGMTVFAVVQSSQTNGDFFPNAFLFLNEHGMLETLSMNEFDLNNPFFQSLGTNGRACATCHLPDQGWTIAANRVKERFEATQGLDPIFRTNDGSNCDHTIDVSSEAGRRHAYSLLMDRGLIRVALAVPGNAEFEVLNVQNQYGCDEKDVLSMYRRPLPSTNLRFLSTVMWDGRESTPPSTAKITYPTVTNGMSPADALLFDLAHQSLDATLGHEQATSPPTPQQQQAIVNFETGLFTAQVFDNRAGLLSQDGAIGGPQQLAAQFFFIGINDSFPATFGFNPTEAAFTPAIFNLFQAWSKSPAAGRTLHMRASIAREALFNEKSIQIFGVAGLNDTLNTPVLTGTCGTCHDSFNVGDHSVSAALNIGVGDLSNPLGVDYLPRITLMNKSTGEIAQTTDPARAMITGKWADIGKVKGPVLRGLASRAPYFHNGAAKSLKEVIEFYDKRFAIGFTPQEKADLVAFLSAL
jgi:hypothetical protein